MIDDAEILIKNNEVKVRSKNYPNYNADLSLDDFLKKSGLSSSINSGLLPVAIRWISEDGNTIVFERPPLYVPVFYAATNKYDAGRLKRNEKERYELPLPWQVYIVTMKPNLVVSYYFTKHSLSSLEDDLYIIPLPNVAGHGGSYCAPAEWSKEAFDFVKTDFTIAEAVSFTTNYIWTCDFNDNAGSDAQNHPTEVLNGKKSTNINWKTFLEAWSKLRPNEVIDLNWVKATSLDKAIGLSTTKSAGYKAKTENVNIGNIVYRLNGGK